MLSFLCASFAFEPPSPAQQQAAARLQQQQPHALSHQEALVKLLLLGQQLTPQQQQQQQGGQSGDSAGGSLSSGVASIARVLRDPQQRSSVMQLLQSLLQPGMISAVLHDAEKYIGPMAPNVMEDAQKMEVAANKIRQSWAVLAPSYAATARTAAADDGTGLPQRGGRAQVQSAATAQALMGGAQGGGGYHGEPPASGGANGFESAIRQASADMKPLRPKPDPKGLQFLGKLQSRQQNLATYAEQAATRMQHADLEARRPEAIFTRNLDKLSAAADTATVAAQKEEAKKAEQGFMLEEQRAGAARTAEEGAAMQRDGQSAQTQEYAQTLNALRAAAAAAAATASGGGGAGGAQTWGQAPGQGAGLPGLPGLS